MRRASCDKNANVLGSDEPAARARPGHASAASGSAACIIGVLHVCGHRASEDFLFRASFYMGKEKVEDAGVKISGGVERSGALRPTRDERGLFVTMMRTESPTGSFSLSPLQSLME